MGTGTNNLSEEYNERRLAALIDSLEGSKQTALLERIKRYKRNHETSVIQPLYLMTACLDMMLQNVSYKDKEADEAFAYGEWIYLQIFPYGISNEDFNRNASVMIGMFKTNSVVSKRCFDRVCFDLFRNKDNYFRWIYSVPTQFSMKQLLPAARKYSLAAKSCYYDEDMFTADLISVMDKFVNARDINSALETELKRLEHMSGIYNVDETMVLLAEQQVQSAKHIVGNAESLLTKIEERVNSLNMLSQAATDNLKQICESEILKAQEQLGGMNTKVNIELNRCIEAQKRSLDLDRQKIVDSVISDSEYRLEELRKTAQSIVGAARLELSKLNRESGEVVARVTDYMKNDAQLQKVLSNAKSSEELMRKMDKLVILNDTNIDMLTEETIRKQQLAEDAKANAQNAVTVAGGASRTASPAISRIEVPAKIPEVNPLLDENIPFTERYKRVMHYKEQMMKHGDTFHEKFDDVLMAVMENANPYLIGPSGCGKTFMVSQISELLQMEFIDIGYINEEYDILGFQTADGGYSCPNFYRCYKYGKIAFCDELDNGNSRATVKLNSFLGNTTGSGYSFPNGEFVPRHANFRIIGAGNTSGNGADSNYNTREKIEESVQQRFVPIYIGYDNRVEREILKNHDDWYAFVVLFRDATDAWGRNSHGAPSGIITTRDVTRIRKYLENHSFNASQILDYEFIQTKDESYLSFLANYLLNNAGKKEAAGELVNMFAEKVNAIREGRVIRWT